MANKTYIPQANDLASTLQKYLTRYQTKMAPTASIEQQEALTELINCLIVFIIRWPKPSINP